MITTSKMANYRNICIFNTPPIQGSFNLKKIHFFHTQVAIYFHVKSSEIDSSSISKHSSRYLVLPFS